MDRDTFAHLLREAVDHLHNRSYLATHSLAEALGDGRVPLSGDLLRRELLDAIGQLKPVGGATPHEADWRRYQHLILRYVEGQSLEQVAQTLGVSVRQASRDHQHAMLALAALLWLRVRERAATLVPATALEGNEQPVEAGEGADLATEVAMVAANEQGVSDLAETLDGVVSTLTNLSAGHGVSFILAVSDTLPRVAISPTLLRQAILNLLIYTCQASPGARMTLVGADTARGVTLRVLHQDSDARSIRALDRKIPSEGRHLFDAARQLLEAQGGSVELGGDDSADLLLRMILPPIQLRKVLVVDDNPDVVGLFRRYLHDAPYRLIQATSGPNATRLAKELRPDVIILDVMIPAQDGWNILQQLRSLPETSETTVIVCSVLPERALAVSLGVAEFLPKPVTRRALLAALERCGSAPGVSPGHS